MKVIFVVNVDWFFVSHFLHLARRAKQQGWEVAIATHVGPQRQRLLDAGLSLIELPSRRRGIVPVGILSSARLVAGELRKDPDTIVHGFGLFGIVVGTMAGMFSGVRRRAFTITGRGYAAVSNSLKAKFVRSFSKFFSSLLADGPSTRWIAENASDLTSCGLLRAIADQRTAVVGGAGVDVTRFVFASEPSRPPFKCALVARMIWSKGVDLAVEAVSLARARGIDIELSLAGSIDPDNPRSVTTGQMKLYASNPGVHWLGHVEDIDAFWAGQHLAILPSRGGEGVPKALIEAAACGRPVLTTNVPGCQEFARATSGWSVAPENAKALAEVLSQIAQLPDLRQHGAAARKAVAESYTEDHLWQTANSFYNELLSVKA